MHSSICFCVASYWAIACATVFAGTSDSAAGIGDAVIRSASSGPWSAATTWEAGRVPGAGDRVLIRAGHRVVYDVESAHAIRVLQIAGTLSFATDRDTRLDVGLVRIEASEEL